MSAEAHRSKPRISLDPLWQNRSGSNDFGGTLVEETISRVGGAVRTPQGAQ
jgi:2-iminoacetate synthase ThiH